MFGLFPSYKLEEIELIIFFQSYHTNICTSSLYEFAILHSKTSWIIQAGSYKPFNVRPALAILLFKVFKGIANRILQTYFY